MAGVTIHPPGDMQQGQPSQLAAPAAAPERHDETPTQRMVREGSRLIEAIDEAGRLIQWRRLNALEEFDLVEIAGRDNSANEEWMLRATIAFGVRAIDGEPQARPLTKAQLRAMIARLDTAGMTAVLQAVGETSVPAAGDDGNRAKN